MCIRGLCAQSTCMGGAICGVLPRSAFSKAQLKKKSGAMLHCASCTVRTAKQSELQRDGRSANGQFTADMHQRARDAEAPAGRLQLSQAAGLRTEPQQADEPMPDACPFMTALQMIFNRSMDCLLLVRMNRRRTEKRRRGTDPKAPTVHNNNNITPHHATTPSHHLHAVHAPSTIRDTSHTPVRSERRLQ